jgi:hypothetical protein
MGFEADKVVSALVWNFRPFVEADGTTPEPSDKAVRHFLFETQQITAELPNSDDEDFVEQIKNMREEDYDAISDRITDLVAELCAGSPTRDQIDALPHRIQRQYVAWLRKELTDPEAPSVATKPSLMALRGGAPTTSRAGT